MDPGSDPSPGSESAHHTLWRGQELRGGRSLKRPCLCSSVEVTRVYLQDKKKIPSTSTFSKPGKKNLSML